jgi:triphosphatase
LNDHCEAASQTTYGLEQGSRRGQTWGLYSWLAEPEEIDFMRPSTINKSARDYAFLQSQPSPGAVRTERIPLKKSTRNAKAFQIIANGCLHQVLENVSGISRGDSEAVHQARVGLRRLRTIIAIFDDMVADRRRDIIKRELKWAARALSPARDLDVLIGEIDQRYDRGNEASNLQEQQKVLGRKREAVYREISQVIGSRRFRTLLLDVAGWIETGDWLAIPGKTIRKLRNQQVRRFASEEISQRRKKILKLGKHLKRLGPVRRHKLRIAGKKLRYATEFFADLFPGKAEAKRLHNMINSLKDLQDALGTLNDIEGRKALTRKVNRSVESGADRQVAAVARRVLGSDQEKAAHLLRLAETAQSRLKKAKPLRRLG